MRGLIAVTMVTLIVVSGCIGTTNPGGNESIEGNQTTLNGTTGENQLTGAGVDDWQYDGIDRRAPRNATSSGGGNGGIVSTVFQGAKNAFGGGMQASSMSAGADGGNIGFSAGGAKDINNFRDNIRNGYLPIPTDLQYEGLFYDYYFDTGQKERCNDLFCPSYSTAVTQDPIANQTEHYMTVGLNSGIDKTDFERKKLNLVVVLDISGSMSSPFSGYYYDRFGNEKQVENHTGKKKIQVASESVAALTRHLEADDRFGMVVFNDRASKAKPLRKVGETDMNAIRGHIKELQAGGGTRLSAGMRKATEMLDEYRDADQSEYENRVIYLTDAMPNLGDTNENSLLGRMEANAENDIHTTFIGMGVDFNTRLVEEITSVEGANYYSVHSAEQFRERMDRGFEYMVTPLVFDLQLELQSDGYDIEKVYGSTAADESTGRLMKVNTLFPSNKEAGKTKGGVVLVKLDKEKAVENATLRLRASWENRRGMESSTVRTIRFPRDKSKYFANSGVRKAVLLTRYADLMKNWVIHDSKKVDESEIESDGVGHGNDERRDVGIAPPPEDIELGKWERQSESLMVSDRYERRIAEFATHFEDEMEAIGDDALRQELEILRKIEKE